MRYENKDCLDPLAEGQRYIIVASPVWCKEDAFQVVPDCTRGKAGPFPPGSTHIILKGHPRNPD